MAVDYLKDYLGVDPNDYSAMERKIANQSPLPSNQSIIPQAPALPRASIMNEGDFANATAPLMNRVYGREQEARGRAEGLSNELQALRQEMAQTSEAEVEKRAALERQMQETMQRENDAKREAETLANRIEALQQQMAQTSEGEVEKRAELEKQLQNLAQERDTSQTSADDLANELQGVQANLQEITQLRDTAVQNYQDALAQQDVIRQQAAENEAMQLEEQRNSLLAERESIVTTLEQDFGVQRSELESLVGNLEGKVGELESERGSLQGEIDNLSSQMQSLEVEKQDALAQQDVIRAESAQAQQDALAQQAEQFTGERGTLEQQIADLQAQISQPPTGQLPPGQAPPGETPPGAPPGMMSYQDFVAQGGSAEDYQSYLNEFLYSSDNLNFQMDGLQNPSQLVIDAVQDSLATGVPAITNDGIQDMIDEMGGGTADMMVMVYGPDGKMYSSPGAAREAGVTDYSMTPPGRPDFISRLPPQKDPRDDFMSIGGVGGNDDMIDKDITAIANNRRDDRISIDRLGDKPRKMPPPLIVAPKDIGVPTIVNPRVTGPNVGGPVERYPISVGVPGTDMFKQFPAPGQTPTIIDEIPRPKPGIIKQVNSVTRTPLRKKMIPPLQKPMSIGGIGGMSGRRSTQPMLRADGGGVNKALEELRNRLR